MFLVSFLSVVTLPCFIFSLCRLPTVIITSLLIFSARQHLVDHFLRVNVAVKETLFYPHTMNIHSLKFIIFIAAQEYRRFAFVMM